MESLDIFILGVESSIALAGFAGLIATFQFSGGSRVRHAPVVALTMIIQCSLMGAAMSALPLIVHTFGVSDTTLWVICSGVGTPITAALMYNFYRNMRPSLVGKSQVAIFMAFQFLTFLVIIGNVLNVADVVFHREPAPMLVGIALSLSIAAYMFFRLLVRPLKRRLREQESEMA